MTSTEHPGDPTPRSTCGAATWLRSRPTGQRIVIYVLLGLAAVIAIPLALGLAAALAPLAIAAGLVWLAAQILSGPPSTSSSTYYGRGTHSQQWWNQGGRHTPGGADW